jgi:predicted pyridoxine 5'-phosphate oxidase superfamily flavin-nucleotide-binding protein
VVDEIMGSYMSEEKDTLTDDMRRMIEEQRLCYVATADALGAPNLSAKGTLVVWDVNTLAFAEIRSPRTVANLRVNPRVEVNVVDPIARKGYRFKGAAEVHSNGQVFERGQRLYRGRGVTSAIRAVVVISVTRALPMISPAYDTGRSEADVRAQWEGYYAEVRARTDAAPDSPSD